MATGQIKVEITGDTRRLERALKNVSVLIARSWWRRAFYRVAVWRLDRDIERNP